MQTVYIDDAVLTICENVIHNRVAFNEHKTGAAKHNNVTHCRSVTVQSHSMVYPFGTTHPHIITSILDDEKTTELNATCVDTQLQIK